MVDELYHEVTTHRKGRGACPILSPLYMPRLALPRRPIVLKTLRLT